MVYFTLLTAFARAMSFNEKEVIREAHTPEVPGPGLKPWAAVPRPLERGADRRGGWLVIGRFSLTLALSQGERGDQKWEGIR